MENYSRVEVVFWYVRTNRTVLRLRNRVRMIRRFGLRKQSTLITLQITVFESFWRSCMKSLFVIKALWWDTWEASSAPSG